METTACLESKGKVIFAKDPPSQRVIDRINKVNALFCDMRQRIRVEESILVRYCPTSSSPSTSDSVPISEPDCCPVGPCLPSEPDIRYVINVTDLDEDVYEILELLEAEVCATNDKLKHFEEINEDCNAEGISKSISDSISKSVSDSNSTSKSKSDSESISKSISDSISISNSISLSISVSNSDSLSKSISDSISKSDSDSDSLSKSESDSISDSISKSNSDSLSLSKSKSDSDSLSNAELACDFAMYGLTWDDIGTDAASVQMGNDGPSTIEVIGIAVLPGGVVTTVIPSLPPFIIDTVDMVTITVTPSVPLDQFIGIIIKTTCGDFFQQYGIGSQSVPI